MTNATTDAPDQVMTVSGETSEAIEADWMGSRTSQDTKIAVEDAIAGTFG